MIKKVYVQFHNTEKKSRDKYIKTASRKVYSVMLNKKVTELRLPAY